MKDDGRGLRFPPILNFVSKYFSYYSLQLVPIFECRSTVYVKNKDFNCLEESD